MDALWKSSALLYILGCLLMGLHGSSSTSTEADYALIASCFSPRGEDDVEGVIHALSKGANVNAKHSPSGQTALMASVLRGKNKIVKYLLEAGADPMIGENNGYHPPHGAAFQGRSDVMQTLIDFGIDVNTFHTDGFVPLHRTCWGSERRHADTLLVLLKHGIDPEVKSQDGRKCRDMTQNEHVIKVLERWSDGSDEL